MVTDREERDRPLTHRVAVGAYVFHGGRVLLLHRASEPIIWATVGGRLETGEDPHRGMLREAMEETGLAIELLGTAGVWFGELGDGPLLAIDFLARAGTDAVTLSHEHDACRWATLEDIRAGRPPVETHPAGFTVRDFERAFRLYSLICGGLSE